MSQRNQISGIIAGALLTFACHLIAWVLVSLILTAAAALFSILPGGSDAFSGILGSFPIVGFAAFFGVGVFQLLYVVPLIIYLIRKRNFALMKGVIVGAVLTALVNGGCWIMLFGGY
ncbi:MAG: hypothetical protein AAF215_30845 [Cyanobacteria bacterium P01_A01_bin.123]